MEQGTQALTAGDYEQALTIADEELADDGESPWANLLKAQALTAQNEHRRALPYARRAERSGAYPVEAPRLQGEIHSALGQPVDSVHAFHRARSADATAVDDQIYINALTTALDYADTRSDHESRWQLSNWLADVDPDHPEASPSEIAIRRRAYAVYLRQQGQYLDAVDLLEEALYDDPRHLSGEALDLGEIYARLDMPEDADTAWGAYLDADVDDEELWQRHRDVATTASSHGLNHIAVDRLKPLLDQIDEPHRRGELLLEVARYQLRDEQNTEARRSIEEYIELLTADAAEGEANFLAYETAANLAFELNQTRLGIGILERAVHEAQPNQQLTQQLADIYARRAQIDQVRQTLDLYIERHDDPIEATLFAGTWAADRNNYELARHYYEEATATEQAPVDVWYSLAKVLAELEEHDEMSRTIYAYLDRRNDSDDALSEGAQLFASHRMYEAAEQLLRRLQSRSPDDREVAMQFADLYMQWSRPRQATEVWNRWIEARGDNPDDIEWVARRSYRANELMESNRFYRRAAEAGNVEAWLESADIYLRQDNASAMAQTIETYLDQHPDRAHALEAAASRYRRANMEARHVDVLVELVELRPESWQFHEQLAQILMEQGRSAETFDHLRRYVEQSEQPVEALDRIGSHFATRHHAFWLLDFYRLWVDDDRIGPTLHRLMGDAYLALSSSSGIADEDARHARHRARTFYLDYLDATEGEDKEWERLGQRWRHESMWRPAAIAYERYFQDRPRGRRYSLAYAETLLHLGESEEAHELLEQAFQHEQRRPESARRIAALLQDFGHYDEAQAFAGHLFLSGDDSAITEGFHVLAEIHLQHEDFDGLQSLISEYMERSMNRSRARRGIITLLESSGQWQLAAEQLAEFELSTIYQFAVEVGFYHYRAGHREQAFAAFEEAAHVGHRPEQIWNEAAGFLADRGDIDGAIDAYDRAIQANPDDLGIRTARGAFSIRRGAVDAGLQDYEFCRESVETFRASQRASFFRALTDTGHFEKARGVARDFTQDGLTPPSEIQRVLGNWHLRSSDPVSLDRAVAPIRAGTWGINETLDQFDRAGHHEYSLRLIEEEFDEGDPAMAAALLLNRSTAMSRLVEWSEQYDRLRRVVDPLQRADERLVGPVGDHRARSGQLQDARLYLQAAVDHRDHVYQPQLGHTLLLLDERQEAFEQFETWFSDVEASPEALESILLRFELAGDPDGAAEFLDRVVEEPSLIDFTIPYQLHYELERHGDPDRAIDELFERLHSLQKLPATAFRDGAASRTTPGLSREDIISATLIRSLETVAALGFVEAVETRLDDARDLAPAHRLDRLRLKLALAVDDVDNAVALADEIVDGTDGARELQQARLSMARKFIAFGAHAPAHRLVDDALAEQTDFRSHEPFVLHMTLLVLADEEAIEGRIDDYLAQVSNRHHARMTLINELRRLGLDSQALRLADEAAAVRPTPDLIRHALVSALDDGDRRAAEKYTRRFFAIADDPVEELAEILQPRIIGSEAELLLPVIETVRAARPYDLDWTIQHARVLFGGGHITEARQLLTEALEYRDHHRDAVTAVVDMLAAENLDVEVAKVIAPQISDGQISDEALWPRLLIAFAEAEIALDIDDRGQSWLERLDETTERSELWRIELADRLRQRHLFSAIGPVIEPIDARNGLGPYVLFLEGLQHLAAGQGDAGVDALRQANSRGVGRFQSHHAGIGAALQAGQTEAATALMKDMTDVPLRDGRIASVPLQILLSASMEQPGGPATVRAFLEAERPRLVDGHGATWTQFAGQLARAFEYTDDPEGAYGFYRDRIWQSLLLRDDDALPIYLNNLAYTYSTTNQHIDRGFDKILRAIVLRQERSSSFLDTLGWLYYRQGDLERAHAEVQRALRTYDRGPGGLHELYHHLQIILRESEVHSRANWIDAHRHRLPPDGLSW